jgi:molybdenum cofactor cytidylyltransferase
LISAIVLAAGKSERMGRPKALLLCRGKTFLENILESIANSAVDECVVVLGHHRKEITSRLNLPSCVYNPDYEQGMTTSIQAGIRALSPESKGAVLCLVDHPVIRPGTIDVLIARSAPGRIVLPVYGGRRGHPVFFASDVLAEIQTLPPSQGANTVVRRDPGRIVEAHVEDPGVLLDIDTPEQMENLPE